MHISLVNWQTKGKKAPRVKFRKNGKQIMEPNLTSPFTAQEFSNGIAALKEWQSDWLGWHLYGRAKTLRPASQKMVA